MVELKPNTKIKWDNREWKIVNVGVDTVSLINEQQESTVIPIKIFTEFVKLGSINGVYEVKRTSIRPEVKRIIQTANQSMLQDANNRLGYVKKYIQTKEIPEGYDKSLRTLQRDVKRYNHAKEIFGSGFVGLINKVNPGNTVRKIYDRQLELISGFIENEYQDIKQKSKKSVFGSYLLKCEELRIQPVSYRTFAKEISRRKEHENILKRQGRRAAYKHEEFCWNLTASMPRHGTHPFHYAHIDHTELDIELNDSVTGKNFGRPQLTLLVDTFSRRILAFYITFDPPSYRSSMMVLRECVRRHGRLPQNLVVDGGKDFNGTYLETLLATFECVKKTRPPAQSRFGSVIERLFGTTNTEFIHNLQGNTQIMKNVRQVTKGVNPKNHSSWTLPELCQIAEKYFYEVYDMKIHSSLGESPREAFERGMLIYGERSQKLIPYSEAFILLTLPSTRQAAYKVHAGKGVKVNYLYYFADVLRHPEIENTHVPVRYDPFNVGHVYVYVNNRWHECISQYYSVFSGCTEKEKLLATRELQRRNRKTTSRFNTTAKQLADFIKSAEGEEVLQSQRIADRELQTSLRVIRGGNLALPTEETPLNEVELTGTDNAGSKHTDYDVPFNLSEDFEDMGEF